MPQITTPEGIAKRQADGQAQGNPFQGITPNQAQTYVTTNVNDLATAKTVMAALAKQVTLLTAQNQVIIAELQRLRGLVK